MATNAQDSGPLPGEKFTLGRWRQIFGAQAAIVGDTDGSAFGLTLPPSGDDAVLGSPTIESVVLVGGHPLIIAVGDTQEITIPASTNPTVGRTDIIAARRDAATFTTPPGPVRLVRIAGTEGSTALPSYSAPLTEALWAVTRKQGQSLNQATSVDLRNRAGWHFTVPAGSPLPQNAPLGTTATRGGVDWSREISGGSVAWVQRWVAPNATGQTVFDTGWVPLIPLTGWEHVPGRTASVRRVGTEVDFRGALRTVSGSAPSGDHTPAQVPGGIGCRPTAMGRWSSMTFTDRTSVRVVLGTDGLITFFNLVGSGSALPVDDCGFTTD